MTLKQLASQIAKLEGKKSQARIGDIRELLAILSDLMTKDSEASAALWANGLRRAKKKF